MEIPMKRALLAAVVGGLVGVGTVRADIPPPPGQKRITVDHKIETEKEYADWVFFTVIGHGDVKQVKLDPKNPYTIEGAGRGGVGGLCSFVAIPKDAVKQYAGEKELHAAVKDGKV